MLILILFFVVLSSDPIDIMGKVKSTLSKEMSGSRLVLYSGWWSKKPTAEFVANQSAPHRIHNDDDDEKRSLQMIIVAKKTVSNATH